ncbi:MAG: hypothetical protein J0L92_03705 [Deltaproteobacteria bacterium]|nr:hypothetical protein [Deltaproteobacteria bacterium]
MVTTERTTTLHQGSERELALAEEHHQLRLQAAALAAWARRLGVEHIDFTDVAEPATEDEGPPTRPLRRMREDHAAAGEVSVEEAREVLARFVRSHFRHHDFGDKERARFSIPVNPQRDDDVRLGAFIARAELAFAEVERLRGEAARWKEQAERLTFAVGMPR